MHKNFTIEIGSEIPTPKGFLKVNEIFFNKIISCDEYVYSEFESLDQLEYIGKKNITIYEAAEILESVDFKQHIIFIKE